MGHLGIKQPYLVSAHGSMTFRAQGTGQLRSVLAEPSMRGLLLMMLVLCGCRSTPTVWQGVYSAEQAARGRRVYEDHCAVCHKPNLTGLDGRLKGKRFMEEWREDNLNSLFIQIKRGMPAENPS